MAVVINGSTGIDKVQDDTITSANLPAGSVLQVVQQSTNAVISTSSTSYQATGLYVDITPTSTTSKIFILL